VILRREDLREDPASAAAWSPRAPYARVLACATNNDGHTKEGITFPSGAAQQALAKQARSPVFTYPHTPPLHSSFSKGHARYLHQQGL
jgi:hypothetical protein